MATRKLTITNMVPITSGVGNYGNWTLYGVDAQAEDGTEITETLKTFQELPMNTLIEVELERRDSEQYGTEYQLKKPKGARYGLRPSPVDDAYEDLKKRVYAIEQHLGLVATAAPSYSQSAQDFPVAPVQQPVAVPSDDEIPF